VTIPLISKLCGDPELRENLASVLESAELIYRARAQAAETIVREIFSGDIDLDSDELRFEIDGREVRYVLHRVLRIRGVQRVAVELIGKTLTLPAQAAPSAIGIAS
jgi:hypothetical protein